MYLDKEKVKTFLPHREPFLFVDSVEYVEYPLDKIKNGRVENLEGSKVLATYTVSPDHPILEGHFPGNPIVPGVVQVEMMAQVASFSLCKLFDKPFEEIDLKLALLSVSNAKFRKPIVPNMELKITALCKKSRGRHSTYDCQIFHNDELMSEASLFASFEI